MTMQNDLFSGGKDLINKSKHKTFNNNNVTYKLADTPEKLTKLANYLSGLNQFAFDTETTSLNTLTTDLVGVSFSPKPKVSYYVPTNSRRLSLSRIITELTEPLENPRIKKIAHNFKFDYKVLHTHGIHVEGEVFDTMVAGYMLDHDQKLKMDTMSKKYLDYEPISINNLIQGNRTMLDVPVGEVATYANEDTDVTFRLYLKLKQLIAEHGMIDLAYNIEFPAIYPLAFMEINGVKIDTDFMTAFGEELREKIKNTDKEMFDYVGYNFNINSWQQVGEVLYDELQYPVIQKTSSGGRATGEDVLNKLSSMKKPDTPVPELILEHRGLEKLRSTYVDAIPEKIEPVTGRLHTSFNQTITTTGRLSSSNPNLQNIPNRNELGRKVRRGFVASEGYTLLSADYSQMELRIIASICKDPTMLRIFEDGEDIHTATAAEIYNKDLKDIEYEERYQAKTINYAIPYGATARKIARELQIREYVGEKLLDSYFDRFPNMHDYIESQKDFARRYGFVKTMYGRRRYLPNINTKHKFKRFAAERQAVNMPIQGASADIMKIAMIKVHNWIQQNRIDALLVLQVHDELVLEIPENDTTGIRENIVEIMRTAVDIGVELAVDSGVGKNWSAGH